ncbi:MAG: RNA chaperone Hfq [Burkholderiales bacterium]
MPQPQASERDALPDFEPNKNVQELYLNMLRKKRQRITILLTNGTRFDGIIGSFDVHTLMLKGAESIVLYKQMIAIISPQTSKPTRPRTESSTAPPPTRMLRTFAQRESTDEPKPSPTVVVRQRRTVIKPE